MRRLRHWLLLVCLWPLGPLSASEILLTGSQDNPGVRSFVDALREQRTADQVRFIPVAELPRPSQIKAATRLILLDSASLEWRLSETAGPAALALRVSRVQVQQRLGNLRPAYLSLLWSDPPLARQLRLTHYLLPQARRVGVLYTEHSQFLLDELRAAARPLGLEIVTEAWPDLRDSRPLQTLLQNSDVLLGIDDPQLYNSKTAKNVLLSSYGRQMALIGPNAGFVKAGALASTLSDQDDWLAVLGQLLDQQPSRWPRTLYPAQFSVLGNQQVARALGIEAIDPSAAAIALAEGESTP
ncbi:ABC transporter substrate-binding protein [Pseudomonas rubra]|uniref:ABC transporter substrate-binding protein n=1 Tax=Pseudomonas rubra TaxID=2942627 RepID=A0ABT5P522_9PSED|nr:ABC transporter substrate-binding protein [Pseudomonas rubra]MDD1013393.1 ABC transporter substrate-binding protein [Pseudomonas rubra]MDD1040488.1 ABC transporter substrate-binding protein [Pseudomonas rubra]MDD1155093.1 ABC transporter substrate-binding protein [Pseudomonas rubra]